ncbi:8333_t:CDS:1, partial [Racocetra fulgida]
VSGRATEVAICLSAVAREHKVRNLCDPTKESAVRLIVEGIRRSQALVKTETRWPRDPLPVAVVKRYIMFPPPGI